MIYEYNQYLDPWSEKTDRLIPLLRNLELKNVDDIEPKYVREFARVHYFGLKASESKIGEASLEMVGVINSLAEKGYAMATLSGLISLRLNEFDAQGRIKPSFDYCVLSYLAIDPQHESLVQSTYANYLFKEGGMPLEKK